MTTPNHMDAANAAFEKLYEAMGRPPLRPASKRDAEDAAVIAADVARLARGDHEPMSLAWAEGVARTHRDSFTNKAVWFKGTVLDSRRKLQEEPLWLRTDEERGHRAIIQGHTHLADRYLTLAAQARYVLNAPSQLKAWCCYARRVLATCGPQADHLDMAWDAVFEAFLNNESESFAASLVDDKHAANADAEPIDSDG